MEFTEVREYSPGDDVRTIDWNVTARYQKPFVKQYVEERELTVLFLVDVSGSQNFGTTRMLKSELAAELSAVLAFSAIRSNDRVGCILFSDVVESFIPPQKGTQHVLRVIRDILYTRPKNSRTNIDGVLDYLNRVQKRRAVVFLVSDFLDTQFDKNLRLTARKHDLVAVVVEDPAEQKLPDVGWMMLRNPESNKEYMVNTSKASVRETFQHAITQQRAERDHLLKSARVDTLFVSTDKSYESNLYFFLRNRAKRVRA